MKIFGFVFLIISVAVYEIYIIRKNSAEKKELWIMLILCFIALVYGLIYIINPETPTIARITIDILGE